MLKRFLKQDPVLDAESVHWLFDSYAWALRQFDAAAFAKDTQLILPTNDFFPGREASVDGMAQLIFDRVQHYAGLSRWSFELVPEDHFTPVNHALLEALPRSRAASIDEIRSEVSAVRLPVPYSPELVVNPEALIVSYTQVLAHYLGAISTEAPPGGVENWPQTREVLTVFLGFGVLAANSAFLAPGGCGSCRAGMPTRPSFLSQFDLTYALAIFSVLKEVPPATSARHLKSSLKSYFKRARRDIESHHHDQLVSLRQQLSERQLPAGVALPS